MHITIDLDAKECDLLRRYCILRGIKGALRNPDEYEDELMEAAVIIDLIQCKLRAAIIKSLP